MTKVGKSHSKGTFAGAFGNDEDAPKAVLPVNPRRPEAGMDLTVELAVAVDLNDRSLVDRTW